MALTWVKIGNLKGPTGPMGPVGDMFKRRLSSTTDNLNTHTERGEYQVLSGAQADTFGLPASATGFFESKPNDTGAQDMQLFLRKSAHPQMFARSRFSSGWSAWNDVGFASLVPLSSSDTLDDLIPGKAYLSPSSTVSDALGLPTTTGTGQRGILEVFTFSGDLRDNSARLLRWTVLSSTPGTFTRSKISGGWRDWTRLDTGGIDLDNIGKGMPGQVNLWGSSTPAGMHPELAEALQPYGTEVHQHARGGQWSSQTAANIGSTTITIPVVGGTIPASGSVTLDTANSILDGVDLYLAPEGGKLLGWLGGVHGEIVGTGTTFTDRGATFTRTNPGVAVTVASPEWVPDTRTGAHLNIYNSGKNDLNVGRTSAHLDRAKAHLDQAVALWRSRGQEFLILTQFVNNGTPSTDDGRTQIEAYNAYVRATYPNNLVDMGLLITQQEMWQWTGITPTAEDNTQQSLGNMPPSIQGDGNHLNTAGDQYMSHKIIQWMIGRKYISEGRVPFSVLTQQRVDNSVGRRVKVWDNQNQREQMIYGDTGLRQVTLGVSGMGFLRRVGQEVTLYLRDVITPTGSETIYTLPSGFAPDYSPQHGFIGRTGGRELAAFTIAISAVTQVTTHTTAMYAQLKFTTNDAWPTSLPGSAVGVIPNQ